MIRPELINSLLERFETTNALIVAPSFQGQTRNAGPRSTRSFSQATSADRRPGRPSADREIPKENGIGQVER